MCHFAQVLALDSFALESLRGERHSWSSNPATLLRRTRFRCAALKVAMIKNQHLAESLFGGNVYDCVCLFEPGG
jgi:hypothetical protein